MQPTISNQLSSVYKKNRDLSGIIASEKSADDLSNSFGYRDGGTGLRTKFGRKDQISWRQADPCKGGLMLYEKAEVYS